MSQPQSIEALLAQARSLLEQGNVVETIEVLKQVLQLDFHNSPAWQILHQLWGQGQTFEDFQRDFSQKNFPEYAHHLESFDPFGSPPPVAAGAARQSPPAQMEEVLCPACGHRNEPVARFCELCGARLSSPENSASAVPQPQTACPNCGRLNPGESRQCAYCGYDFFARRVVAAEQPRYDGSVFPSDLQQHDAPQERFADSSPGRFSSFIQQYWIVMLGSISGLLLVIAAIISLSGILSSAQDTHLFRVTRTAAVKTQNTAAVIATAATNNQSTASPENVLPTANLSMPPTCTAAGQSWVSPQDHATLVCVPGGVFLMGASSSEMDSSSDEKPQREVYLDPFWIDQHEVTNAMFARFVAVTDYVTDAEKSGSGEIWILSERKWVWSEDANWRHPYGPGSSIDGLQDHPVVQVSWNDADAYCRWAGRNLPSEAQWEKAARGTDGRLFPWGSQIPTGEYANFADKNIQVSWADQDADDQYRFSAPVGSYPKGQSPYGALDMAGNVYEWVADYYLDTYYSDQSAWFNPVGPSTGTTRAVRGGSWDSLPSWNLRTADRHGRDATYHGANYGFRCGYTP